MSELSTPVRAPWWPATVHTPRLCMRPVTAQDLDAVERLWRDERVRQYLGGPVTEEKIRIRRSRIPGMPGVFAVTDLRTRTVLGTVTVEPHSSRGATEVSYTLLPEHWGRGVGREAVGAAVEWALRSVPGTEQIVAVTQAANTASRILLESLGMRCTGELVEYGARQAVYRGGTPTGSDD
ncbi:GNAT family N-acetyltransferase [Streptomyces sp. NPDC057445]|uniref:GNAT family N-acetyltransferase n=1 Tax=Streptomyces sp. NPDC057445 TaxID=3346136 RepID=UPI003689090B